MSLMYLDNCRCGCHAQLVARCVIGSCTCLLHWLCDICCWSEVFTHMDV